MDTVRMPDETTGQEVETLRIVDYKTGGTPEKAVSMEQLVQPAEHRPSYIFQIFLYAWVMTGEQKRPYPRPCSSYTNPMLKIMTRPSCSTVNG